MTSLKDIRLYTTQPHACSYLPDQRAQTLFIDPDFHIDKAWNSKLSELGFRRSGAHVYRPNCEKCQQCVSCRVRVQEFSPNRSFLRVLKRNSDLEVNEVFDISGDEYFLLYKHYITVRHADGDMFPPSREQFASFLLKHCDGTHYYELRLRDRLLGVMVVDHLENGLSAVYTFYDPLLEPRSLGTFAILWQLQLARQLGLQYLYLGFWIRDSRKMSYKTLFRPMELLIRQRWLLMT